MDEAIGTPSVCSISPWLSVANAARAVDFYKSAFGAIEVYRLEDPGGSVVSKLSILGAEFWLNDSVADENLSPGPSGSESVRFILTVADPNAVFGQALEDGASEIFPVGDSHGWRVGRLVDPFGYHWEIGRPLAE